MEWKILLPDRDDRVPLTLLLSDYMFKYWLVFSPIPGYTELQEEDKERGELKRIKTGCSVGLGRDRDI